MDTMKQKTDLPEDLCIDEAVLFIAERHNVTPQQLLRFFLITESQDKAGKSDDTHIPLEPNEFEILRGLNRIAACPERQQ